ncbi:MAG: DEAD/DEAH box helicase [Deltaproteobacteria bacterium]|nr:DEAD/DEAH box helicase [Deltaproteobacteria bacterium]
MSVHEDLLDLLAVGEGPHNITELTRHAAAVELRTPHGHRYQTTTLRADLIPLISAGLVISKGSLFELAHSQRLDRCWAMWKAGRYQTWSQAISSHHDYWEQIPTVSGPARFKSHQRPIRRALTQAVFGGQVSYAEEVASKLTDPLLAWCGLPLPTAFLQDAPAHSAGWVLDHISRYAFYHRVPLPELLPLADALWERHRTPELAHVALRERLLRGQADEGVEALLQALSDGPHEGPALHALLRGEVQLAAARYGLALTAFRARHRAAPPDDPAASLMPLALLLTNQPALQRRLKPLLLATAGLPESDPRSSWRTLLPLTGAPFTSSVSQEHPVGALLEGLASRWEGVGERGLQPALVEARRCGWSGVERELMRLVHKSGQGLVALRAATEPWERVVESLLAALGVTSPVEEGDARVAWILHATPGGAVMLDAREQLLRGGSWTKGRPVALERIYRHKREDGKLPLTPEDERLIEALVQTPHTNYGGYTTMEYSWDPAKVWTALIGHPRVFRADDTPVTVVLAQPTLRVRTTTQTVTLSVEPPPGLSVQAVGSSGYEVTVFTAEQRKLAALIGEQLVIPADREEVVAQVLAATRTVFPPREEPSAPKRVVAPPGVALTPYKQGLRAAIFVAPLGADGERLAPGTGSAVLLTTDETGGPLRVKRDLAQERAAALPIEALLRAHATREPVGWRTSGLENSIALLSALMDAEVPTFWPEGGALRLYRPRPSDLSLTIATVKGWFLPSGTLRLDTDTVLDFAELLERLRASPSQYIRLDQDRFLQLSEALAEQLRALGAQGKGDKLQVHPFGSEALAALAEDARATVDKGWRAHRAKVTSLPPPAALPAGLRTPLRPYQAEAFQWLVRLAYLGAGALLADDMGLGKTLTALTLLVHRRSQGPALVIAPTSVEAGWVREAATHAPGLRVLRLREHPRGALLDEVGPGDVVVVSYGLLLSEADALAGRTWATLVLDESQSLKNAQTQRYRAAKRLRAGFSLALTGTPIENHLGELHAQLSLLVPGLLGSAPHFRRAWQRPIERGDAHASEALQRLVQPFLLRRTKGQVLAELPPRTEVDLLIALDEEEASLYEAMRQRALAELESEPGAQVRMSILAQLTHLRMAACSPRLVLPESVAEGAKQRTFLHLVDKLRQEGHRALVFSQFVRHLTLLREALDARGVRYQYLDGATTAAQRDAAVEAFQRGEGELFLISLRAGGSGLHLTGADYVIHMDPWWNPAVEDQASDRAHRIGQTRPVTTYRLIAEGTVEERILSLHRTKRDLAEGLLAGAETAGALSPEALMALIREGAGS